MASSPICDCLKWLFSLIFFLIKLVIIAVLFVALLWAVRMLLNPYDDPMLYITAASSTSFLKPSYSSIWNITLGVGNLKFFYDISYEKLNISLLYGTNGQLIAQTQLGSGFLTEMKHKMLHPQLHLSLNNISRNVVAEMVQDEIRGWMLVKIRVAYMVKLVKRGHDWKSMVLECGSWKMIFNKICNGTSGSGIAPGVPCYQTADAH